MRKRGTAATEFAGASAPHIPVLSREVVDYLGPRDGGVYVDATFGAGGHTQLILDAANCRVIGIDRDQTAIAAGFGLVDAAAGRLTLVEGRFSALESVLKGLGIKAVDGILIDLGVSSMQLDRGERGFSFRQDAPLSMRMGGEGPTAADVLANASESDLASIIFILGEERFSRQIARAIVRRRESAPVRSTQQLADLVSAIVRSRPGEIHPATRTFQALRIFVNEELDELATALIAAERVLAPGGRLAVISFHSLEDRIVKRFLAARSRAPAVSRHQPVAASQEPSFRLLTSRAVSADPEELAVNPRARSARLRVGERTAAPPSSAAVEAVPQLPSLAQVMGEAVTDRKVGPR